MRWYLGLTYAATLMGIAPGSQAADAAVYQDAETGFTFSQYSVQYILGKSLIFRIAVPSPVPVGSSYDTVLQVVAPADVGWAGLAWGGKMTSNPLTVAWANGNTPVVSSRYSTVHAMPSPYTGASYEKFKTGNRVNGTHWQYTVKCSGCTTFTGDGRTTTLNPKGGNRLAFAYSSSRPSTPSSNTSSFNVHDSFNYWTHDFATAGNTAFASLVARNLA